MGPEQAVLQVGVPEPVQINVPLATRLPSASRPVDEDLSTGTPS